MCFPRKPGLGHYNASRAEWLAAYRTARIIERDGGLVETSVTSIEWKAGLIVAFDRKTPDNLSFPARARLATKRLIDEMIAEE